jgi:hypothetical protein
VCRNAEHVAAKPRRRGTLIRYRGPAEPRWTAVVPTRVRGVHMPIRSVDRSVDQRVVYDPAPGSRGRRGWMTSS